MKTKKIVSIVLSIFCFIIPVICFISLFLWPVKYAFPIMVLLCTISFWYLYFNHNSSNTFTTIYIKLALFSSIFTTIFTFMVLLFGFMHGMYKLDATVQETYGSILKSPNITFEPKPKNDDYSGSIVILYKFGCKDCEAVYEDLCDELDKYSDRDVYWLSSRSKKGKAFLEKYPTEFVPTGFYIYKDKNSNVSYIQKPLCSTDKDSKKTDVFDKNNLTRLFELQQEEQNENTMK